MCYKIKFEHFIVHSSNKVKNKILELECDTPSDSTMDWMEENLLGFRSTTKAITFFDTLENRLQLKKLDKIFVPVSKIKFDSNLNKYLDNELKNAILQSLDDHDIYTAYIRYDGSNIIVSKNFRSKAKIASISEKYKMITFYKHGKELETLPLDYMDLPF